MVLLVDRGTVPGLDEVLRCRLGHTLPATSAHAVRRARRRWREDPAVRRVLAWVETELGAGRGQKGSDPF